MIYLSSNDRVLYTMLDKEIFSAISSPYFQNMNGIFSLKIYECESPSLYPCRAIKKGFSIFKNRAKRYCIVIHYTLLYIKRLSCIFMV